MNKKLERLLSALFLTVGTGIAAFSIEAIKSSIAQTDKIKAETHDMKTKCGLFMLDYTEGLTFQGRPAIISDNAIYSLDPNGQLIKDVANNFGVAEFRIVYENPEDDSGRIVEIKPEPGTTAYRTVYDFKTGKKIGGEINYDTTQKNWEQTATPLTMDCKPLTRGLTDPFGNGPTADDQAWFMMATLLKQTKIANNELAATPTLTQ